MVTGMGRLRIDRLAGGTVAVHTAAGQLVIARCHVADRPAARAAGLLFTTDLAADEGVWLEPCGSVHTLGLRARIGCVFLDRDGRVLRVADPLRGGRLAMCRGARAVVEAPAGVLGALSPGERLVRRASASPADAPG